MAEQQKPVAPAKPVEPPKKMEFRLLGHNYVTPDLVAKVTGKASLRRRLPRRGHGFHQVDAEPASAREGD